MMENSLINLVPFDPAYIIFGLAGLCLLLLILSIVSLAKIGKLNKKYNKFMEGADASSLEEMIQSRVSDIESLKKNHNDMEETIRTLLNVVDGCYQRIGVEKYDSSTGMGGKISFAYALLDKKNSGVILNSIHTREGSYLYLKEIKDGKCEVLLGKEEQIALNQALNM